ncbi:DNA-3-methyladenine glycosylase I [Alcaligenaceae bacterium B3P038]|nr:DNA-3-methyladenine glycosylase I [Alcaligenaceae bacterium B3P038]
MATSTRFEDGKTRCNWVTVSPLYVAYHDDEWGRPVGDDNGIFERLSLEGFQSGLSWLTILRKRPAFRAGFADFDIAAVASFGERDVERLLGDAGIVRHRGKIEAVINNAARAIELKQEAGSLARFLWSFQPPPQHPDDAMTPRTTCDEAIALSKALKKRGWKFVGPTTMYAAMQAIGLVNDHAHDCHCRKAVDNIQTTFKRQLG